MKPRFIVYIGESGDENFKFNDGGSGSGSGSSRRSRRFVMPVLDRWQGAAQSAEGIVLRAPGGDGVAEELAATTAQAVRGFQYTRFLDAPDHLQELRGGDVGGGLGVADGGVCQWHGGNYLRGQLACPQLSPDVNESCCPCWTTGQRKSPQTVAACGLV